MVVKVKTLDITLVSAEGYIFSKLSVYAVVVVTLYGKMFDSKTTPVAGRGGSNPRWDFPLRFIVDRDGAEIGGHNIYIQLMSRRRFFCDKAIGLVHFPMTELQEVADDNEGCASLIKAPITDSSSGVVKGKLKFSFRFGASYDQ